MKAIEGWAIIASLRTTDSFVNQFRCD